MSVETSVCEKIQSLLKKYGGTGCQLFDLYRNGKMSTEDAATYKQIDDALSA